MESINNKREANVVEAASSLLNEGKKLANDLYEEGRAKVSDVESYAKQSVDETIKKVQDNPLSSVLIAAGIGFLLSRLMKK